MTGIEPELSPMFELCPTIGRHECPGGIVLLYSGYPLRPIRGLSGIRRYEDQIVLRTSHPKESYRTNSAIKLGAAVSNPAISNIPGSLGLAIENCVAVMATTMSFASIPIALRYARRAWKG